MQRRLADVLDYFEWEGLVAENDPITSSDAHVASRAHGLLDEKTGAIARLLDLATANVDVFRGEPVGRWHGGTWQGRTTPWRNGWPAELNAGGETYVWLTFAPTDEYERSEPRSEPAFLAAISFEPATPDTILCLMDPVWQTPDDVLVRQVDRRTVRVTKLIYLSELAVQGVTLTHQAEKLGEWADGALAELSQLRDPRLSASA